MNRPKLEDYLVVRTSRNVKLGYYADLENYCDHLEKALDKACECLEEGYGQEGASYEYFPNVDTMVEIPFHMNFKEWKEWCLKDE